MGTEEASIEHMATSQPVPITTTTATPITLDSASLTTTTAASTTLRSASLIFTFLSEDGRLIIVEEIPPSDSLQDMEEDVDSQFKEKGKSKSKKQGSLVILKDAINPKKTSVRI